MAPDADPLAPEDSKSSSKQLKLKLSVWLVTNGILYHAFCQIVTGYGTQSLGLELCLLAAYSTRTYNKKLYDLLWAELTLVRGKPLVVQGLWAATLKFGSKIDDHLQP